MLSKKIGHKYSYKSDEPEAYLVEWITNQLIEFCMKNNALIPKNENND